MHEAGKVSTAAGRGRKRRWRELCARTTALAVSPEGSDRVPHGTKSGRRGPGTSWGSGSADPGQPGELMADGPDP